MKMDRRPLYAYAILFVLMIIVGVGQRWVPGLAWLWIPLVVLLGFLFQRFGWLDSEEQTVIAEPPLALKIVCAVLGLVGFALVYLAHYSTGMPQRVGSIGLFILAPIVMLLLWLIFRRKSNDHEDTNAD
jgi:hypothetical protein